MEDSFGLKLKQRYEAHIVETKAKKDDSFDTMLARAAYHGNFEGMPDDEIEQVKTRQDVQFLPSVYIEFLRVMGRKSGGIFGGCDITLPTLAILKTALFNELQDSREMGANVPDLPPACFVFLSIQGTDFFYFDTATNADDPEVYYYMGNWDRVYLVADRLSDWFWNQSFNYLDLPQSLIKRDRDDWKRKNRPSGQH
jgi:hypothetical protein